MATNPPVPISSPELSSSLPASRSKDIAQSVLLESQTVSAGPPLGNVAASAQVRAPNPLVAPTSVAGQTGPIAVTLVERKCVLCDGIGFW